MSVAMAPGTTHVTGIFTDLGTMLGASLRGEPFDRRRAILYTLLIAGFVSGSAAGSFGYRMLGCYVLVLPISITTALSALHRWYRHGQGA